MKDEELLPWVGLDGFILIHTVKLFLGLMIMLGIPALFVLAPVYFIGTKGVNGWFHRLSAVSIIVRVRLLWFTLLFNYYMAAVVFYALYMFYRNLSIYRQAFMRQPGSWLGQVTLRKCAQSVGTIDVARKLFDSATRAVVISNVSTKYRKSDLLTMFQEMGLKDISSVVIVQNRSSVKKLLVKRNAMVDKLEHSLRQFYHKIINVAASDLDVAVGGAEKHYGQMRRIDLPLRIELMKTLLSEETLREYRPRIKVHGEHVDAISWQYGQLVKFDAELDETARRFAADNDYFMLDADPTDPESFPPDGSNMILEELTSPSSVEETLLLAAQGPASFKQLFQFKGNVKDYGLTLWGSSMSIIVIFGSQHSAAIASQTLLSCRPFSMEAKAAPQADDIVWSNLYKPVSDRAVHRLFVNLLYVMINLLFTSANIAVTTFLKVDLFTSRYPFLKDLFDAHPELQNIMTGILAPLFYNLFLLVAPYMLYGLSIFQGNTSKTGVQQSLMRKYTWLLFIQTFILTLMSSAFLVVIEKILKGQYKEIIKQLLLYMPQHAAFFMNIILQRAAISMMLFLIKPGCLFLMLFFKIFYRKDLRAKILYSQPDRIFIGAIYPEYVLFVFMVVLAFLPLTPVILLAGLAFYILAYLAFRYHFIYTFDIGHESGGRYWTSLPTPIMVGCLTGQVFTTIQLAIAGTTLQALCMAPLMIVSVGLIVFLRRVFKRRALHMPLGSEANERSMRLAEQIKERQSQTVYHITQETGEDVSFDHEETAAIRGSIILGAEGQYVRNRNHETVPFDFGHPSSRQGVRNDHFEEPNVEDPLQNPYCNPIMFKRYPTILLPPAFFHVLRDVLQITLPK